jgi:transcriptional regulator with XRE-family HTH domain
VGDGKKLKQILLEKNFTVKALSKASGVKQTTLYSIIQKDSNIRLDYGYNLANVLGVDVSDICSTAPLKGELSECIELMMPENFGDTIFKSRVRTYLKESMIPLVELNGPEHMEGLDNIIRIYSQLSNDGKTVFLEMAKLTSKYFYDTERVKQVEKIRSW